MNPFWQGFEKRANAVNAGIIGAMGAAISPPLGPAAAGWYSSTKAPEGEKRRAGLRTGLASLGGAIVGGAAGHQLTGHGLGGLMGATVGSGVGAYAGHRNLEKGAEELPSAHDSLTGALLGGVAGHAASNYMGLRGSPMRDLARYGLTGISALKGSRLVGASDSLHQDQWQHYWKELGKRRAKE